MNKVTKKMNEQRDKKQNEQMNELKELSEQIKRMTNKIIDQTNKMKDRLGGLDLEAIPSGWMPLCNSRWRKWDLVRIRVAV